MFSPDTGPASGVTVPADHFVNPLFHLVIFISLPFILHYNRYGIVVGFFSALFLLSSTYTRATILQVSQESSPPSQKVFYDFFVASLASWVAAIILEGRISLRIANKLLSLRYGEKRAIHPAVKYAATFAALNSTVVMGLFCVDVGLQVLETSDWSLIPYHLSAAVAKTASTVVQGTLVVLLIIYNNPLVDIVDKTLAKWTVFHNSVTIGHSLLLTYFGGFQSLYSLRTPLLICDLAFRIALSSWCLGMYATDISLWLNRHFLPIWTRIRSVMGQRDNQIKPRDENRIKKRKWACPIQNRDYDDRDSHLVTGVILPSSRTNTLIFNASSHSSTTCAL